MNTIATDYVTHNEFQKEVRSIRDDIKDLRTDIKLSELKLDSKIDLLAEKFSNLAEKVSSMPDKLFNRILFAGVAILAVYKLIEFAFNKL